MNPIKSHRQSLHLTLQEYADRFRISYSMVRQLEYGQREMPNTLIDLAPAELSQAYAQWRCRKRAAVVAALNLAPGVSYVEKQIKLLRPKLPPLSYLKILLGVESDHELAKLLRVRHRSVTIALRTASHGRTNSSDSGRVLSELPLEIAAALSEGEGFRLLEDMQTSQCRYAKIRNPFD